VKGVGGQTIELPIAGGPPTGYAWRLDLPEGVEQVQEGEQRLIDPAARLGGASGGFLRVRAPAGQYLIEARLARPWQLDQPIRVVQINLEVA
jgi:predicted secreted protein